MSEDAEDFVTHTYVAMVELEVVDEANPTWDTQTAREALGQSVTEDWRIWSARVISMEDRDVSTRYRECGCRRVGKRWTLCVNHSNELANDLGDAVVDS